MLDARIKSLDADVIGLQEVDRCHIEDFVVPFCNKYGYGFYYCSRNASPVSLERDHGLVLMYRKTVLQAQEQSTDVIANAKAVNRVYLNLRNEPSRNMCFIVGHLQSRTDGSKEHIRTQQAKDIVALLERSTCQDKFLLLDANSDKYREGEELFEVFSRAGYEDHIWPVHPEFTTKKCRINSFDSSKNGVRVRSIDYILCHVDNVLRPYSCVKHIPVDTLPNSNEPSDHLPQVLMVSLEKNGC